MIEAKLLVGRFLNFTPTAKRGYQYRTAQWENVICPPLQIEESSRKSGGGRQSDVSGGINLKKVHRNFKWLPWYEGDISYTNLTCDVLTGPMTGCVLVSWKDAGGSVQVGHLGTITVTENFPASINDAVKQLWYDLVAANPANIIGGFIPTNRNLPQFPPFQKGDSGGETWGLFTTSGEYFAVFVYAQSTNRDSWRIAAVHKVPTLSLTDLQNL